MSCKHCLWQEPIETKKGFKYSTTIEMENLVVRKRTLFGKKGLYCLTIDKCPMCGDDTIKAGNWSSHGANLKDALKNFYIERFGEKWLEEKMKNYK